MKRLLEICIVTFPLYNYVPLTCLIKILEPLAERMTVISGDFPTENIARYVQIVKVSYDRKTQSLLIRIPKYLLAQLKISYYLFMRGRKADIVFFFAGGTALLLPLLVAKLLGKKTVQSIAGSGSRSARDTYERHLFGAGGFIISGILSSLEKFAFMLSDKIATYTPGTALDLGLDRCGNKLISRGAHFVDNARFCIQKSLADRRSLVGYLGRLSPEKGVMNLVKAIPWLLAQLEDIEFLIVGGGPLFPQIEEELKHSQYQSKVTLIDWVPNKKMPYYLNQIKLLILPSYTESLPQVILEAMACGTPVLATPVGSIPDLIVNGETGFILENNSPESITESVITTLEYPKLDEVVTKARQLVIENYTYEAAVGRYQKILTSLSGKGRIKRAVTKVPVDDDKRVLYHMINSKKT